MKKECQKRGIATLGHEKIALQRKLNHRLSGIKRPTALLCDDDVKSEELLKKHDYMVSHLEPLHDLKTTICKLLFFSFLTPQS